MDLLEAVILGLVQGVTEWLPISSTAHLRIVPALMGRPDPGAAFTAVIQLGTVLAVLLYFGKDLWRALKGWLGSFRGGEAAKTPEARMGWAVFVGTIPIVVMALVFRDQIEGEWRSLTVIGWMLIVVGILLGIVDRMAPHVRDESDVKVRDGWIIGLSQVLSLVPGASRSGSTMIGAMLMGFDRASAARVSFLLSVPSITAAGLFNAVEHREMFTGPLATPVFVASTVAFFSGYLTIAALLGYLRRGSLMVFVAYRILLGIAILFLTSNQHLPSEEKVAESPVEVHVSSAP
ncbi:MAG: Undecaprenyl-diphosphatase [Fimbriimonadaceae bacterium]|nr:Undecaprenyl-diphosphatase [Fimbriimonadaceae bacterium]